MKRIFIYKKKIFYSSGGISGAILDIYSNEATTHAAIRYGLIRSSNTDISNISKNTGFDEKQVEKVKNYLFIDKHCLEKGYVRFDPDFVIGESWWRLAFEPQNIKDFDILLLKHELYEMNLISQGYPQLEAHYMTNDAGYDYQTTSTKYYLEKQVEYKKRKNNIEDAQKSNLMFSIVHNTHEK